MTSSALEEYLELPYRYEVLPDPVHGGYYAEHPELPGCVAQGESTEEVTENLEIAKELWIEARLEAELPVPVPNETGFSGRLSLRMAPSLHTELAKAAERQGISINQYLNTVLARHLGSIGELEALKALLDRHATQLAARGTEKASPQKWKENYAHIESAAFAFRHGRRDICGEVLKSLPEPRMSHFMLALLCLEGAEEEGLRKCVEAYSEGLTDAEAHTVYSTLRLAIDPAEFKHRLLKVALRSDDRSLAQPTSRLVALVEKVRQNYERASEWLVRAMGELVEATD